MIIHKASTRGHANHGWLDSHHSFSFAGYYNPERMNFGVLRVLNDDIVQGGMGFGAHPHDNMEIISIPLSGDLEHKDSMGNTTVIREGDVQILSAGTGMQHSEYNKNPQTKVNFLQIWVFPKTRDTQPRYDQKTFDVNGRLNKFQTIVAPGGADGGVSINQDAWLSMIRLEPGFETTYKVKKQGNGVYLFVLEGKVDVNAQLLDRRDAAGITGEESIRIKADSNAEILVLDIPMLDSE